MTRNQAKEYLENLRQQVVGNPLYSERLPSALKIAVKELGKEDNAIYINTSTPETNKLQFFMFDSYCCERCEARVERLHSYCWNCGAHFRNSGTKKGASNAKE